jgi:hypothetical protein
MACPTIKQITRERPLGLTIVFCAGIRVIFYYLYGLTYDPSIPWWQMLDIEVLRAAPLQSIYLMHMQPPLLNLLYAAALALPGTSGFFVLHVLFLGSSLIIVALLYAFLRRMGFRPYSAALASSLFGVLPQVLLYENIYFYSHLEAVLVLTAAILAATYFEHRRIALFVGFAACLVALALLRSLFHLAWIAFVLFSACVLDRRHPRRDYRTLVVSLVAVLLVGMVYLKNLKEFGIFSASSWDGMSLMHMALPGDASKFSQAIQDIRQRVTHGELSQSTQIALDVPDLWFGWLRTAKPCDTGGEQPRALCSIHRSNGKLNFNHIAIVDYSRDLRHDAFQLIRLYPGIYAEHVASSFLTFLGTPSWEYQGLPLRLRTYTYAWDKGLLYDSSRTRRAADGPSRTWWDSLLNRFAMSSMPLVLIVSIGVIFVVVTGIRDGIGYWRGSRSTADWVFPMLVVGLFCVVPNMVNGVEAHRMRYSVEPLIYLGFLACISPAIARLRTPRSG